MATLSMIPLAALRVSPFNLRTPDETTPEFAQLMASIEANGILEPLIVEPTRLPEDERGDIDYDVLQGGHRLTALLKRAALQGLVAQTEYVPCQVLTGLTEAEAREAALATTVIRRPLHPVDEYEAFAALEAEGLDAEGIARRFGLTIRQVRQRLKLAELLPAIRQAWREGAIGAETAMTFTLAPDEAAQARSWEAFGKMTWYGSWSDEAKARRLRDALVPEAGRESTANNRFWLCVGEEAYCAAGGRLTLNLFADERIIEDPSLLANLARAKALAEAEARAAKLGFGGALWKPSLDQHWNWPRLRCEAEYADGEEARIEWIDRRLAELEVADGQTNDTAEEDAITAECNRLEAERDAIEDAAATRALSAEDRARSAVVADVRADGVITLEDGWLLEATKAEKQMARSGHGTIAPAEAAEANAKAEEPKGPPASALQKVSEQLTEAAYRALLAQPGAALPILVATLRAKASPLKLKIDSREARPASFKEKPLAEELASILEAGADACIPLLAAELARGLDLTDDACTRYQYGLADPPDRLAARTALVAMLDQVDADFQARLRGQFDAAAYFAAAPKSEALRAWAELKANAVTHDFSGAKKAEIAAIVAAEAKHQGWLPDMMRTERYALLTTRPAAEKAAAKEATRKGRARKDLAEAKAAAAKKPTPSVPASPAVRERKRRERTAAKSEAAEAGEAA